MSRHAKRGFAGNPRQLVSTRRRRTKRSLKCNVLCKPQLFFKISNPLLCFSCNKTTEQRSRIKVIYILGCLKLRLQAKDVPLKLLKFLMLSGINVVVVCLAVALELNLHVLNDGRTTANKILIHARHVHVGVNIKLLKILREAYHFSINSGCRSLCVISVKAFYDGPKLL